MARARQQIKDEMTAKFMANTTIASLYGFPPNASFKEEFSRFSLENIIFDIVSYSHLTQEQKREQHEIEVEQKLLTQKNGRLPWYAKMARDFQYGFDLIPDTDVYNNEGFTIEQIEDSKVVKYAAVEEKENGLVVLKVAGEGEDGSEPLPQAQEDALVELFREVRPAGVQLNIVNFLHDKLYINIKIYRNPLILNANGMNIVDGTYPVPEAIDKFLKNLPFNGEFVIAHLVDALQRVAGVNIPHVLSVEHSYIDNGGYTAPAPVEVKVIPTSGHFKVEQYGIVAVVPPTGIQYVV